MNLVLIFQFIAELPRIYGVLRDLWLLFKGKDYEHFKELITSLEIAVENIKAADTVEKKENVAREISRIVSSL